jgi:hypothetical protein
MVVYNVIPVGFALRIRVHCEDRAQARKSGKLKTNLARTWGRASALQESEAVLKEQAEVAKGASLYVRALTLVTQKSRRPGEQAS